MTRRVPVRLSAGRSYEIEIGADALAGLGATARRVLATAARRVVLISNQTVFALYGAPVVAGLRAEGFSVVHWLMGEGERHKSLREAERALAFLSQVGLERSDALVALGGGVVGDLAGFAAAVYLRGIAWLQAPTTLLAQIDASVGGKTAVNTRTGKNLIGAFHQPRAVVIDTRTLDTLPARELTAGWCEAIKQGAVGSRRLFAQTRSYLTGAQSPAQLRELSAWRTFKIDDRQTRLREATQTPGRSSGSGWSTARRRLPSGHTGLPGVARPSSPHARSGAPAAPAFSTPVPTRRGERQST